MTVYAAEAPSEVQLGDFYNRFYINDSRRSLLASALGWFRGLSERARARSLVTYAVGPTGGFGSSGSLVDIGAGNGMLSRALRVVGGSGSHVVSIDAARDVLLLRDVADETWHVTETELVRRLEGTSLRFGAVFFSHTLEHFTDPLAVLRSVTNRLTEYGRIFVDCPSGLHPLYTHAADLNIPDLMFVTPNGVRAIAELAGCAVLDVRGISPGPSFLYRPSDVVSLQYLGSFMFLARAMLTRDGYYRGGNPLWWRFTLSKSSISSLTRTTANAHE